MDVQMIDSGDPDRAMGRGPPSPSHAWTPRADCGLRSVAVQPGAGFVIGIVLLASGYTVC